MVVLHSPGQLTYPAGVLQLVGGVDFFFNRLAINPHHWIDPDTYSNAEEPHLYWFLIHGLLVLGQLVWGLPLVKIAQWNKSNFIAAYLFILSSVLTGIIPAIPLLKVSRQPEIMGFGVYICSVLHIIVFVCYLIHIVYRAASVAAPVDYFSRQQVHDFVGKLEAFHWFSGFPVVVYSFRHRLVALPKVNGLVHVIILMWHFYMLFYFGSHKPRYESATGLSGGHGDGSITPSLDKKPKKE